MKIKIETARNGLKKEHIASIEANAGDLRMPMKRAAIAHIKQDLAAVAEVYVQCEHCGGEWKSIMTVGEAEQAGQYYDTFNQHVCHE